MKADEILNFLLSIEAIGLSQRDLIGDFRVFFYNLKKMWFRKHTGVMSDYFIAYISHSKQ